MDKCDHEPVEQIRGEMGNGDYFDSVTNSQDSAKKDRLDHDYHQQVELHDDNKTDVRIVCKHCFLSTGWMKVDAPNMPAGIGLPAVRSKWDEIKQYSAEEHNALHRASGVEPVITRRTGG